MTKNIRTNKKDYYRNLLEKNGWFWTKKNGSGLRNYPKYFLVDDKEEYNMDVVANCFNNFFVNIGSDQAEKNPDQGSSEQSMEK